MSTDWDVWCVDCDAAVTRLSEAREHLIIDLLNSREAIDMIASAAPGLNGQVGVYVSLYDSDSFRINLTEWRQHKGHALKPRNEYGAWSDQCFEQVKCAGVNCGGSHRCVLKEGHEGGHE